MNQEQHVLKVHRTDTGAEATLFIDSADFALLTAADGPRTAAVTDLETEGLFRVDFDRGMPRAHATKGRRPTVASWESDHAIQIQKSRGGSLDAVPEPELPTLCEDIAVVSGVILGLIQQEETCVGLPLFAALLYVDAIPPTRFMRVLDHHLDIVKRILGTEVVLDQPERALRLGFSRFSAPV